jgi:hypothetical protein
MFKRFALLAVTAALALVPVTAAYAGHAPGNPGLTQLKPCVPKFIKAPSTTSITQASNGPDSLDVENKYADDDGTHNTVESDATVEHDDMTYDGC